MTRERLQFLQRLLVVVDLLVTGVSFLASYFVRDWLHTYYTLDLLPYVRVLSHAGLHPFAAYVTLLLYVIPIWGASIASAGTYRTITSSRELIAAGRLLRAGAYATVLTVSVFYLLKLPYVGRSYILLFSLMNVLALLGVRRILATRALNLVQGTELGARYLLIVGTGSRARAFAERVGRKDHWPVTVVGFLDRDETRVGSLIRGMPVLGTVEMLGEIIEKYVVDEVVFAVPRSWLGSIQDAVDRCETEGIRAVVLTDLFCPRVGRLAATEIAGWPAVAITTVPQREGERLAKRALDLAGATLALLVTGPLLLVIAVAIRLTSPGPILFRQERVGLNGRRFTIYKFRTMVVGADRLRSQLQALNEMDGPVFKITRDPRATRLGALLRRCSLDELPQLFNVIRGEMSLVGPRPPIPSEVTLYEPWQRRRLSVKPGLTCLWQVNGRNRIGFRRWMRMDLEYIDNWSFWLDLKLLLQTIPAVLRREGAS